MDADRAERDARELATTFQDALSNIGTNIDEDAMDVDSDRNICEGEDEKDDGGDEMVLVDSQAQSAKEWVCVCIYAFSINTYTPSHWQVDNYILNSRRKSGRETEQSVLRLWKVSHLLGIPFYSKSSFLMQQWAINAIASGLVPDIIVDSDHMIEYLKYAATRKLFDKKGGERSTNQRLSAVSICFLDVNE